MEWYLGVLKKYAVFDGRARRKEYWMFLLFHMIVVIGLLIVNAIIMSSVSESTLAQVAVVLPITVYMLGVLCPALGVTIRRLHDTGKSGWWIFISLVPVIGGLWFLYLMVIDGTPGDNQYGPSPKAGAAA